MPDEFIDSVFAIMALAKEHTFQILAKGADRRRDYLIAFRREQTAQEKLYECLPANVIASDMDSAIEKSMARCGRCRTCISASPSRSADR